MFVGRQRQPLASPWDLVHLVLIRRSEYGGKIHFDCKPFRKDGRFTLLDATE